MTKFILLTPFKYEEKKQIIMNVDCIKCVTKERDRFSKIFISDELKPYFKKEQLTADDFLYVTKPIYEDIVAILTCKGDDY
jgi:hypothetical protein